MKGNRIFRMDRLYLFYPKMRSARIPFGTRAIMKKFIYVCNETHYIFTLL